MIKLLLFVFCICACFAPTKSAYCDSPQYAQILNSGDFLYRYDIFDQSASNIICLLEKSYYVEVVSQTSDKTRVNYNGVTGYVKPSAIRYVKGVPTTPYPTDIKILTYSKNCYLRSTPEKSNNTISILPANCKSLIFIGRTVGENLEDFGNNTWYYVEYLNVKGYIYSSYVASVSSIFPNGENLAYIKDATGLINPLTNLECVIIVFALTLPTLFILFIIFRRPKVRQTKSRVQIDYSEDNL